MTIRPTRRAFMRDAGMLFAGAYAGPLLQVVPAPDARSAVVDTSSGKVRGYVSQGVSVFKGVPYGGSTSGRNRFMPPTKAPSWAGTRDTLAWGPTAPQTVAATTGPDDPVESEDCLTLNVFTPALRNGRGRPVMVWLHPGGFATGNASYAITDGTNLARTGDVVVVTLNHRLGVFGFTSLAEAFGSDFASSSAVGLLDIVASLRWVRENIERFGGDPNLVTIFGQSGGGRKVSALMAMPGAKGLFHRAVIESGALLRLVSPSFSERRTSLLLEELGLKRGQVRELQSMPTARLLQANAAVIKKMPDPTPGSTPNTPMVDGLIIPAHPWDPAAPTLSASVPLLIGYVRTEETWYDRPTPEKLALDEAGLRQRVGARLETDPDPVIAVYRKAHPKAKPWDLHILIATDHPRGVYTRELAKRKAVQGGAPAYLYRFDWETPAGGGHMRSPHTVEIAFVFNNIAVPFVISNVALGGGMVAERRDAHVLAQQVSAAWVAFARSRAASRHGERSSVVVVR